MAQTLHFGRAAGLLDLTQPSLTRSVQNLEKEVRAKLLERGSKEVSLTEAGQAVLVDATRILRLADALPGLAQQADTGEAGTVRLAFTAMGAYAVLGELLTEINDRFPAVKVTMTEMVSEDQFDALARGDIDLAVARPPIPQGLDSRLVHSEDMVVAVPSSHELARAPEPVTLEGVFANDYIGYSRDEQRYFHDMCATMLNIDHFLASHNVSEIPAMLALVRAGRGIALVPRSATLLNVDGVVFRQLDPAETRYVSLHLCWNADNSNPALQNLIPSIRSMPPFGQLRGGPMRLTHREIPDTDADVDAEAAGTRV